MCCSREPRRSSSERSVGPASGSGGRGREFSRARSEKKAGRVEAHTLFVEGVG